MKIICICGSTKFKDEYNKLQHTITMSGNIFLSTGVFSKDGEGFKLTEKELNMLKLLHLKKIEMSDEIVVINKDLYIGDNTQDEIDHAVKLGKPVYYLYN